MQYDKENNTLRYNLFQIKGLREQSSILGGGGGGGGGGHKPKYLSTLHKKKKLFYMNKIRIFFFKFDQNYFILL